MNCHMWTQVESGYVIELCFPGILHRMIWEQIWVEFELVIDELKCRLQNGEHFLSVSMC